MTHEQKPESAEFRTQEALLPCPFCGAPAERLDFNDGENTGGSCISCTRCEASGHVEFGRKENFISRWNTRVDSTVPNTVHDDDRGVDAFSLLMREKMKFSREVKGRGGWQNVPAEVLSEMLRDHVEKGDPVDVANFCMMLSSMGASIAEARGAAEQRWKDAEGTRCVGWLATDFQSGHILGVALETDSEQVDAPSCGTICWEPLRTYPANVAALEARVKELEGEVERLKKPEFYAVSDLEDSWLSTEELMDSLDGDIPHFETVKIDCFRRVSRIWAFYDGKKVREFADKEEAEVAASAAIREGGEHG